MRKIQSACLLAFAVNCGAASAATNMTFVSATGNNTNNCSTPALSCDTLQRAINNTTPGGVVRVISSGNFGTAQITTSMSIIGDGSQAAIVGSSGAGSPPSAVHIAAGANDVVHLRGLTINQLGTQFAVSFLSGAALHVKNCDIRNGVYAINFAPSSAASLYIEDTFISEKGSNIGVFIKPAGTGPVKAVLDRVRIENRSASGAGDGVRVESGAGSATADVTISNSVIAGSGNAAVLAGAGTGPVVNVMIHRSILVNNKTGLSASGANSTIRVGDSVITGNATGLLTTTLGKIISYKTNKIEANGTDGSPTSTTVYK